MAEPTHLAVGHLTRPHGIHGEMYVQPLTDHPERTFAPGVVVFPGGRDGDLPDPDLPPLRIDAARPFKKGWLVTFGGVEDRSTAALLQGRYLLRPIDELGEPAEDELFYHELVGMSVVTTAGADIGRIVEVYEVEPAHLLEVRRSSGGGNVLVPLSREIVVSIDRDGGRLVVDPPEGLLDL